MHYKTLFLLLQSAGDGCGRYIVGTFLLRHFLCLRVLCSGPLLQWDVPWDQCT
jgi:hypothetical protein